MSLGDVPEVLICGTPAPRLPSLPTFVGRRTIAGHLDVAVARSPRPRKVLWEHVGRMAEGPQGGVPALSLGFDTALRPLLALCCDEPREELSQPVRRAPRTLGLSAVRRRGCGVCVASGHVDRHAVDKKRCEVCLKGSLTKSRGDLVCKHRKLSRKCPFRRAIFFYLKKMPATDLLW